MLKNNKQIRFVLGIALALVVLLSPFLLRYGHPDSDSIPSQNDDSERSLFSGDSANLPSDDYGSTSESQAISMQVGSPIIPAPFPRGENQRRRYMEPVHRDVPERLLIRRPVMLAKLPADGRTEFYEHEKDEFTAESRRLVFDPTAFDRILDGQTARLLAPTTDNQWLRIDIEAIKTRSAHTHTLQGQVAGDPLSLVQFVYHDGILHGNVDHPAKDLHYEYRILSDGHLMVRTLDVAAMTAECGKPGDERADSSCGPDCRHDDHQADELGNQADELEKELSASGVDVQTPSAQEGSVEGDTTGWTTVDLVVGYGSEARAAQGGTSQIEALIIDAVDRMTLAFENSLITDTEMMLLGTIEDPVYVFPGEVSGTNNSGDELGYLDNPSDGILDAVSDYATQLGADFKAFVIKTTDGSAGVAYRPGNSSITARTYISTRRWTFSHELGHNLGCDHSWGDSSQAMKPDYGWRFDPDGNATTTNDRRRTIMAYDWNWGNGDRVAHFANPAVFYGNAPTGAPKGFNITTDPNGIYADPRYEQGGYDGADPNLAGYVGNADLGALNAITIRDGSSTDSRYGALYASNRDTRTTFAVPTPAGGSEHVVGSNLEIFFTGGDYDYTFSADLYKGVALVTNLGNNLNPATERTISWPIPQAQTLGNDYWVRITLSHPSYADITADSAQFSIVTGNPRVIAQSPSSAPSASNLSQVTFSFTEAIDTGSFSTADDILSFTGPSGSDLSGQITGSSWANGDTELTVTFNTQSATGYYRMVIGPDILDLEGNAMDQDVDTTGGELWDDTYTATLGIASGGGMATIWSDLVGGDSLDAGWSWSGGSWATGIPAETPTSGPSAAADGGNILATNLSGDYNSRESSIAETPTINCSGYGNVSLSFQGWSSAGKNDTLFIDAWNGSSWQRVYTFTGSANGSGNQTTWTSISPLLDGVADNNADFKLRWGLSDVTRGGSGTATGWQIDQIVLVGDGAANPMPAPRVVAHSPSGNVAGSHGSFHIQFSNPMNTSGFSLADISSFTGPGGNISVSDFEWISASLLRIDFLPQSASGTYNLTLAPTIPDINGRQLDQDGDGTPGETGDDTYTASFGISDNLTVTILAASVAETAGTGATTATVSRTNTSGSVVVGLSSNDTSEITVPATVTIADGQTASPPFDLNAVDDLVVDGTQSVTISASADGYEGGSDTIEVTDNEVAGLAVVIAADSVAENDGPAATTATVSRNTDTTNALVVNLSSDDTSEATVPGSVTIPAGQASTTFDIDAVDDAVVDGSQTVTITASDLSGSGAIASTDFTGRTVNGATASNITWTVNGVADPGDLTTDAPDGLFDTAATQDQFVPNRNVDTEGTWSVDIPLTLSTRQLSLSDVVMSYQHFNNSGGQQTANRTVNWTVAVIGSSSGTLDTVFVNGASSVNGSETATFSPELDLTNSETYVVRITADGTTSGNNTGLTSLAINGTTQQFENGSDTLIVTDDEVAILAGFTLSKSAASVDENGGTDDFTVVLDAQPAGDVVIDLSGFDANEVSLSDSSLTFTNENWDIPQAVTITGVNDSTVGDDTTDITLSINDGASDVDYRSVADQTIQVTCINDDADIAVVNSVTAASPGVDTVTLSFDAGAAATKLVVGVSSENSSDGNIVVTYNGAALTQAVDGSGRCQGIWYLDSPYTGGSADLVVDMSTMTTVNGIGLAALSVSGIATGYHTAATASSHSLSVNVVNPGSLVFANFGGNGSDVATADSPLTPLYAGEIGSAVGAAGYETQLATGSQTYSFTASGYAAPVTAAVVFAPFGTAANNFANWIDGYSVAGLTGFSADPDKDGVANGLENYFGTNPSEPSAGLTMGTFNDGENPSFTFSHPINDSPATEITASYQWSKDLVNFFNSGQSDSDGTTVTITQGLPSNGIMTATATCTGTPAKQIFVQVKVFQDTP